MNEPTSWIGVAALAIGILSPALFAWLRDRDKLQYDAKLVSMEQRLQDCQQKHTDCEEKHGATQAEQAALRAELDELKAKVRGG